MDESRLGNIRIYVVANEIGFIILWLLFLYLFRSDYGGVFGFSWNETVHAGYHGGIFLQHSRHLMDDSACAAYRDSDNVFFALEAGRRSRHVSLRQLCILWHQLAYGGNHGVQHIFLRSDVLQCGFASG